MISAFETNRCFQNTLTIVPGIYLHKMVDHVSVLMYTDEKKNYLYNVKYSVITTERVKPMFLCDLALASNTWDYMK